MLSIRIMLARENKRRDAEPRDESFDNVYIVKVDEDGNRTEVKVSKVRITEKLMLEAQATFEQEFLDLTDRQNRDFRYVL